jgi:hypothetical protein
MLLLIPLEGKMVMGWHHKQERLTLDCFKTQHNKRCVFQ